MDGALPRLEELSISNNNLTSLDLRNAPNLRKLEIAQNAIVQIQVAQPCHGLDVISLREQRQNLDSSIHDKALNDARCLAFGGTKLVTFAPTTPFLNLNILELASTGLRSLPSNFGIQCRNLRTLNLNYNAIQDLRPLIGIEKLQSLYLSGNRLSRLRRNASFLKRIAVQLLELDLRSNPLTIGFYTPQGVSSIREKSSCKAVVRTQPAVSLPPADWSSPSPSNKTLEIQSRRASQTEQQQQQNPISVDPYLLLPLDANADQLSRARLDEDTALRRRVYEMLLAHACPQLSLLDSLAVDRAAIGDRDEVWSRLLELGVLRGKEGDL